MSLSPKEIDDNFREVKSTYIKLHNSSDPHEKKVGFYGLRALSQAESKVVEKLKKKSEQSKPPRFF